MRRALSASELTGPALKTQDATSKVSPSVVQTTALNPVESHENKDVQKFDASLKKETQKPDTLQKKGSSTPGSPQKTQHTTVTAAKVIKDSESDTQASPAPGQKSDATCKPVPKQSKTSADSQQESGNVVGFGGTKTTPDDSKTTESTPGKMFGFGSSIFSSASALISSAVADDSRNTPPGSRKMSAPGQVSPKVSAMAKISSKSSPTVSPKMSPARETKTLAKKPEQEKKAEEPRQNTEGEASSHPPKAVTGQGTCPLCKAELNLGSKDPLNYNTCTECNITVCNQCGFSPMPLGNVSELLTSPLFILFKCTVIY